MGTANEKSKERLTVSGSVFNPVSCDLADFSVPRRLK
jgi:hypothetical protein